MNTFELVNELGQIGADLNAAIETMQVIVNAMQEEGILDQQPASGIPGVMVLLHRINGNMKELDAAAGELLKNSQN